MAGNDETSDTLTEAKEENEGKEEDYVKTLVIAPTIDLNEPDDEEIMKWAELNIGENSNTKLQLIEELRDMIFERGECLPPQTDDAYLLRFLRARHFIVRMAHRLMVNYLSFKETTPQLFYDINYDKLIEIVDTEILSVPPYFDQNGRRMLIIRFGNWNSTRLTSDELIQAIILILQIAILEPKFQILGGVCIIDAGGLSAAHAWQLSPILVKRILSVAYRSLPHRVQAIHIINHSRMFDVAFSIIKPFLSDFLSEKLLFHEDVESLHKHIYPKFLPKRYGGIHQDYSFTNWLNALVENDTLLQEITLLGYEGCRDFVQKLKMQ